MANIPLDPNLPNESSPEYKSQLRKQLHDYLRKTALQLNSLSKGNISAFNNAYTSAPTSGSHAQGDFIMNSQPSESGSASSKYIIHGWRCTVSGEPGTWVEVRTLTGN